MDYSPVHLPDLSAHRAAAMSSGREAACTVRRPMTPKDSIWPLIRVDDVCNEQSFCGSTPSNSPSPSRRPAPALRGAAEPTGQRRNHKARPRLCPDLLSCFPWWERYRGRGPRGLAATLGLGRLLPRREHGALVSRRGTNPEAVRTVPAQHQAPGPPNRRTTRPV
jgi:hypothetical protein